MLLAASFKLEGKALLRGLSITSPSSQEMKMKTFVSDSFKYIFHGTFF